MASGEAATSSPSEGRKDGRSVCDANARAAHARARHRTHSALALFCVCCSIVLQDCTMPAGGGVIIPNMTTGAASLYELANVRLGWGWE